MNEIEMVLIFVQDGVLVIHIFKLWMEKTTLSTAVGGTRTFKAAYQT